MIYLLDTNVLIERARTRPNRNVEAWMDGLMPFQVTLCPIVVAEFLTGVFKMSPGSDRVESVKFLRSALKAFAWAEIDRHAAAVFGLIRADLPQIKMRHNDLWLGAIAKSKGLVVATRNVRDFRVQRVDHFNPF